MSYITILTEPATKDIRSAINYITIQLSNPTAANSLKISIKSKIQSLPIFPEKYPLVNDMSLINYQIRYIPIDNYLLFYKIYKPFNEIQVLRFLYAKSNWLNILKTNKTIFNYPENLFENKHYINEEKENY